MLRFNVLLIGDRQCLPIEIESESLCSLTDMLTHQRFLIGRFAAEAEDLAYVPAMIPVSRIHFLYEVTQ